MCRIAGIVDLSGNIDIQSKIADMRDAMHRGGPDDFGVYIDEVNRLALGHRRLSLIDLSSAGHQPMIYRDLVVVYNGEIYNFLELRNELANKGFIFKTATDTEVILAAYSVYGTECFKKFNGMFAIAIYNRPNRTLILARDHAGIKPLYYHISNNKVVFASEIRGFKAFDAFWSEDEYWKAAFLTFGHLPHPYTTLKSVQPLEKGSFIEIDLSTLQFKQAFFSKFNFVDIITNEKDAVSLVKEKLEQSVKRHLISDAPIGLFLSGGVDSSLLTLIAHKYIPKSLKTLSIVFEDASLNEAAFQKLIIDKTKADHKSFLVTEKEFSQELPEILEAMDQPSTDGVNSYFICKYAKKYGLTAVLSGLGADELFGGYPSFNRTANVARMQKLPAFMLGLTEMLPSEKFRKVAFTKRKDLLGNYLFNRGFYTPSKVAQLLKISKKEVEDVLSKVQIDALDNKTDKRNQVSWTETNLYMQNQLLKDSDYMSMWHSIEIRVPFLDKELMQAAHHIAPHIKYNSSISKHLLIKAFNDVLPKEIWQRKKQGFTFPFYKWMKNVTLRDGGEGYENIRKQYLTNQLHWSRYWSYLLLHKKSDVVWRSEKINRILFLNLTSFSATGGIEKFNRALLKSLDELDTEGLVSAHSISLHDIELNENYFAAGKYKAAKGNRVSFMWQLLNAASNYNTVVVGHLNLALPAMSIKRLYPRKKFVLIAHGIEVWDELKGAKKQLLEQADVILAVSSFTKTKLIEIHKIDPEKIKLFYNTIDPYFRLPTKFDKPDYLKKRYNIHNGEKVVYTMTRMSSLEQYKGYDQVLAAFPSLVKKYPGIKYIIGGKADIVEKQRVEKIIQEKQLNAHVILSDYIADEEVQDHFKLADVFIMPSSQEGFGIVFIEAMACGLPVIGGNIDGTVDALQNGELGKLVDPFNVKAIENAIEEQLNLKNGLNGKQLQQAMLAKFSFIEYKKRLKEILVSE
jgi:asparagine synthase (glutamine-hydrolysing)